ncbi:hypothetical protein [Mesorhizobium sp.]|uniref:hypothetical protein n=1 Tax=Mesorhizobium sp. TaxID=1871066 RepID=UPI00121FFD09|nr:hypothetical protein [Mesorhizobium sp.]TIL40167.1 MAG: hypothetical protein E5Y82_06510 [Mesorhizobium sp.]
MSLSNLADLFTVIGFPLGLVGVGLVLYQMRTDKLSASAGAVATIHENIRARIDMLSRSEPTLGDSENPEWTGAFRDLLNDLEVACATYLDSQFSGRTGKLAEFLIHDMLKLFQDDLATGASKGCNPRSRYIR